MSPTAGGLPPGMKAAVASGELPSSVAEPAMEAASRCEAGNPLSASSSAGVTTCSKLIVP